MAASDASRSHWVNAERARAWAVILAGVWALVLSMLLMQTGFGSGPDAWGRPLAPDFSSFWVAARLVVAGAAPMAWDPAAHGSAELAAFPRAAGFSGQYYAFFYPPPYLLLLLPFALLPYGAAVVAWTASTTLVYVACVRRLMPPGWCATLAAVAFPALLVNVEHGQNGAVTASLLASGASLLDRRPTLAGLCLGLMVVKPQIALLVVPALVAARRWRALACAGLSAAGSCFASSLVFGAQVWHAFVAHAPLAVAALENGLVGDAKMVSSFAAARLLGAGVTTAWILQATVSAAALATVVAVARRRPGGFTEMAAVGAAACLASPFLLDYDLMICSVPLIWLAWQARDESFSRFERFWLAVVFLFPLLARPMASFARLPLVPVVVAGLVWVVAARIAPPGPPCRAA